jgi:chorismate mutase
VVEWRVRAIRGATTASENTVEAIREAVTELLDELEAGTTPSIEIGSTKSIHDDSPPYSGR